MTHGYGQGGIKITLRIEISIVPHGVEEEKFVIHTINVSNVGMIDWSAAQYAVEHNKYREDLSPKIVHDRDAGALKLAEKALRYINEH